MLVRSLPSRLARLGCQPLALRTPLLLRTLAAKAERKAGKKAAQALKLTRALQQEEAQAFRSGKVLPHEHDATCSLIDRAVSSHRAASGRPLIALDGTRRSVARQLWDAPIACVVVGSTAGGGAAGDGAGGGGAAGGGAAGGGATGDAVETTLAEEPTYLYANLLACEAHGAASFTELIGAPSRLPSSLPGGKAFESGYRKKLAHGTTLLDATRWAVPEDAAAPPAVAYTFTRWLLEDGAVHGPRGFRLAPPLTADARGGVEAAVEAALMQIKRLKGDEGRGNKDEAVVAAVAEMKRCREQLVVDDQTIAAREQLGI